MSTNYGQLSNRSNKIDVNIGIHCIKQVDSDQHLGTLLSSIVKCENDYIQQRVNSCKSICYATQALGSYRVPVSPVTSSKLYWQVCMPKLCYGLEVMNVSDKGMDVLEKFHNSMSKQHQGLPQQCSNLGSTSNLGWKPIEIHMDLLRLLFLWRLLLLPMTCIYKVILLKRFEFISHSRYVHSGPTWQFVDTCRKYGLLDTVQEALETGCYMSLANWKSMIHDVLFNLDVRRWKTVKHTKASVWSISM